MLHAVRSVHVHVLAFGFKSSARAMAMRCFCPPLSPLPPGASFVAYLRTLCSRVVPCGAFAVCTFSRAGLIGPDR
jgi:hypothetical protein